MVCRVKHAGRSYNLLGGNASPELNRAVRPLVAIFLYLTAVLLGGALLAPWAWAFVQWLAAHSPALKPLADAPFHRYVNRCFLVIALLGLWPFLRVIGASSLEAMGLSKSREAFRRAGQGIALGLFSLGLLGIATLLGGAREFQLNSTPLEWLAHFVNATLSAAFVGLFEELLFRGAIFGALRRSQSWPVALILSSALYALLHFFQRAELTGPVTWSAGLALLPGMMRGFTAVNELVPAFFNLTLVGAILALAYQRTGSLWFSIGLHAGWVWCLKTFAFATHAKGNAAQWFWGTGKMVDGWLAFGVLVAALVFVWKADNGKQAAGPCPPASSTS